MENDSLRRQAIRGTLWFGGSRVIVQATTWLITIVVVGLLGPAAYGLFGFAMLVTDLPEMIAELGLGAAIIQKRDLDDAELETLFWLSMASAVGMYAIVWLAAPAISVFFNQSQLTAVLRVSMVAFVISSARIVSWNLLTKRIDFKRRSLAEGAATISASLVTLAAAYRGWGAWALVAGLIVRHAGMTIACYWMLPWWPRGRFRREAVRKVLGFSARASGGRIAWYFASNADFLIVGKLLGQEALGLYSMVFQLATLPADRITTVIQQVTYPVYARLQDQPDSFKRFFLKTVTLLTIVSFPLMMGLLAVADVAVPALLKEKWQAMVVPLQIMCGMGMVLSVTALVAPAVLAKGQPGLNLRYYLFCLVVLPPGFLVGSYFGLAGVCWAWMLLFPCIALWWFRRARTPIGYGWAELISALTPAVVSTVVMGMAVLVARFATGSISVPLWRLVILIAVGLAGYGLALTVGFRRQVQEIREIVFSRQ